MSTLQASSRPCTPINRCAASDCRRTFPIPDDWRLCFVQARSGIQKPATGALLCDSCNRWRRTTKSNRPWPSNGILKLVCTTVSRVKRNWPGVYTYWRQVLLRVFVNRTWRLAKQKATIQWTILRPFLFSLPIYLKILLWEFFFWGKFGNFSSKVSVRWLVAVWGKDTSDSMVKFSYNF